MINIQRNVSINIVLNKKQNTRNYKHTLSGIIMVQKCLKPQEFQ